MGEHEPPGGSEYAATIQRARRAGRAADDVPPYQAGTLIDARYRVLRLLGEGGMGRVYEGEHLRLERRVAIKVLRRKYSDVPAMVERFHLEALSAGRIGHPNVVQVFDYGTSDDGDGFLVMELLRGQPLSEVLRQGPIDLAPMLTVLAEVAMALRAAHGASVIHRDLKPANIFLLRPMLVPSEASDEQVRVRVLDFGMAKLADLDSSGLTGAGEILGTPEYMAPEQAAGGRIDARVDIYALGCVAHAMWCGQPPFAGDNYVSVLHQHLSTRPPRLSDLRDTPAALDRLVGRMLAKPADERPADMGEVLHELQAIAAVEERPRRRTPRGGVETRREGSGLIGLPPVATPTGLPRLDGARPRIARVRWLKRWRRLRRWLALGTVAFVAALAGAWVEHRFADPPLPRGPALVVLATTPAGALLRVDGRDLGERSPAVARLAPGEHDVVATLPHYRAAHDAHVRVDAAGGTVAQLHLVRDVYKLAVASEPDGAQVFLDGYGVGTTPVELEIDPWEPHTLRLERLGRKPWERYLPDGERPAAVRAVLQKRVAGDER